MTLNVSCGCLHLLSPTSPTRGNWGSSRGHYHQMQGVLLTPSPPPGKGSAGHSWERRGNQTGWLGMCVGTTHFTGKENQFHFINLRGNMQPKCPLSKGLFMGTGQYPQPGLPAAPPFGTKMSLRFPSSLGFQKPLSGAAPMRSTHFHLGTPGSAGPGIQIL